MLFTEFVFLNRSEGRELVFTPIIEGVAGDVVGCPRENGNGAIFVKRLCCSERRNLRRCPVHCDDNLVLRVAPICSGYL